MSTICMLHLDRMSLTMDLLAHQLLIMLGQYTNDLLFFKTAQNEKCQCLSQAPKDWQAIDIFIRSSPLSCVLTAVVVIGQADSAACVCARWRLLTCPASDLICG